MNKLREMRKSKKISVKEIAKKIGVTTMSIYHYENGKRRVSIETAKKLADIYGCKVDDLI